jgi:hypothetical protein
LEEASHLHAVRQTGRWRCCWGDVGIKEKPKEASHPHAVRRSWSLRMLLGVWEKRAALTAAESVALLLVGVTTALIRLDTIVGIGVSGR